MPEEDAEDRREEDERGEAADLVAFEEGREGGKGQPGGDDPLIEKSQHDRAVQRDDERGFEEDTQKEEKGRGDHHLVEDQGGGFDKGQQVFLINRPDRPADGRKEDQAVPDQDSGIVGLKSLRKGDEQSNERQADPQQCVPVETIICDQEVSQDGDEDRLGIEEDRRAAGSSKVDAEVEKAMLHHQEEPEQQDGSSGAMTEIKKLSTSCCNQEKRQACQGEADACGREWRGAGEADLNCHHGTAPHEAKEGEKGNGPRIDGGRREGSVRPPVHPLKRSEDNDAVEIETSEPSEGVGFLPNCRNLRPR